jgi:hypothetical protein
MRIRIGAVLLACCCAAAAGCTAAAPKGPNANATVPAIGKPAAPASEQAALSNEAFTPYAGLGAVSGDGLAPGETYQALHTACMNDAGYGQYANDVPFGIRANRGLVFPQAAGPWGYIGISLAEQYAFTPPENLGPGTNLTPASIASLPTAVQAAGNKCFNIVIDFNNHEFATSLAGIETMNNEISDDVIHDPDVKKATTAWSACMAQNGYTTPDAITFALSQQQRNLPPGSNPSQPAPPTNTQIAMAVTDARCTQSTDLSGIWFAVQADYEQQFVTANQQALNVAVRRYKADYAKELSKLPALLHTASDKIAFTGPRGRVPAGPGKTAKPTASPSQRHA